MRKSVLIAVLISCGGPQQPAEVTPESARVSAPAARIMTDSQGDRCRDNHVMWARVAVSREGPDKASSWIDVVGQGRAGMARAACSATMTSVLRERGKVERGCSSVPLQTMTVDPKAHVLVDSCAFPADLFVEGADSCTAATTTTFSSFPTANECETALAKIRDRGIAVRQNARAKSNAFLETEMSKQRARVDAACLTDSHDSARCAESAAHNDRELCQAAVERDASKCKYERASLAILERRSKQLGRGSAAPCRTYCSPN